MANAQDQQQGAVIPAPQLDTPYPLIDCDPHVSRLFRYARPSDWAIAAGCTAIGPAIQLLYDRQDPVRGPKGTFAKAMRLTVAISVTAGILTLATRSANRFYGFTENVREQEMDMREMVDKVKQGKPLYGISSLTPYMQGVAARNSRYAGTFYYAIPWFNFVNHQHHGVDTAKYYQQAERELETEAGRST